MIEVRKRYGGSVVALMEVDPEQVSQYGCAAITPTAEEDVVTVTDLVEKPVPGSAPSNWILIGRYVCDPAVFGVLRETPPGRGGEIQLTDALLTLAKMGPAEGGGVHGVLFHGRRYDTGNKLDYLRTLVQFACERSDLAEEIVPWLRKYLDSLLVTEPRATLRHGGKRDRLSPSRTTWPRSSAPSRRWRRPSSAWTTSTAWCWPRTSPRAARCLRSTTRPWTGTRCGSRTSPPPPRRIRSRCR